MSAYPGVMLATHPKRSGRYRLLFAFHLPILNGAINAGDGPGPVFRKIVDRFKPAGEWNRAGGGLAPEVRGGRPAATSAFGVACSCVR